MNDVVLPRTFWLGVLVNPGFKVNLGSSAIFDFRWSSVNPSFIFEKFLKLESPKMSRQKIRKQKAFEKKIRDSKIPRKNQKD